MVGGKIDGADQLIEPLFSAPVEGPVQQEAGCFPFIDRFEHAEKPRFFRTKPIIGVVHDKGDSPDRGPVCGEDQAQVHFGLLKEGVEFRIQKSFAFTDERGNPAGVVTVNFPWHPNKSIDVGVGFYLINFTGHCCGRMPNCSIFFLKESRIPSRSSRVCSQV